MLTKGETGRGILKAFSYISKTVADHGWTFTDPKVQMNLYP